MLIKCQQSRYQIRRPLGFTSGKRLTKLSVDWSESVIWWRGIYSIDSLTLCMLSTLPKRRNHVMLLHTHDDVIKCFRDIGHLCGEFTGPPWIPRTRPAKRSFDVFFDLHLNKQLSKQSWGWWSETLLDPLWHQSKSNDSTCSHCLY